MISILYRSKMQKSGHGLTLQNGMDRGSFSTFSAVLLFVVSSLLLVCDGQYPRYAQPSAWQSDIPASLSSPDDILHRLAFSQPTTGYIFVHGWIPCTTIKLSPEHTEYVPIPDWRNAGATLWSKARWINGMAAAHAGITETGKTIVCGHWHCSFGHAKYEGKGREFDNDPDFSPYCAKGILAIDACTAVSGKVNCIVIDD